MTYLVYKLTGENGLIYYGSTSLKQFNTRIWSHTNLHDRHCSAKKLEGKFSVSILENNIPYRHIVLIREGYYIHNFECVNHLNPDSWFKKVNPRKWWRENPEKNKNFCRKHYSSNKEAYKIYAKKYNEDNKEARKAFNKKKYVYIKSMGGDPRFSNNLIQISPDIFS